MNPYVAEILGTFLLILIGNGVVANVLLDRTKGHAGGWIVVTAGWALAVYVAVAVVAPFSGAHLNPAVSLGLALHGTFEWTSLPGYVAAQLLGAFLGSAMVVAIYRSHFAGTESSAAKLACFSTAPQIREPIRNALSEVVGTFVLVVAVLYAEPAAVGLGSLGALPVALVVFAVGIGLGGTTGYAINPARDLGPRIAHALLPVPGKGGSDWGYAWIPIVGPLLGGALATGMYHLLEISQG